MSALFWILASFACVLLEFLFSSFRYIWLAIASLITALAVKFALIPTMSSQLLTFIVSSAVLLILARPVALRSIKRRQSRS